MTSWKGKWCKSPCSTSAVEFYKTLIKELWTYRQDLLKTPGGLQQVESEIVLAGAGFGQSWAVESLGTTWIEALETPCTWVSCAFPSLGLHDQHLGMVDFPPSTFLARNSVGEGGRVWRNPINNHVILPDKHLYDLTGKTGYCSSEAEDTQCWEGFWLALKMLLVVLSFIGRNCNKFHFFRHGTCNKGESEKAVKQ